MSTQHRLARAIVAADLMALDEGMPPRAARLARRLAGRPRVAASLADLEAAPRWLRNGPEALRALARQAALAVMAPALARCIDGQRLNALAGCVGTDTLDWAIALGTTAPQGGAAEAVPEPAALKSIGMALLAAMLPSGLATRLGTDAAPAADSAAAKAAVDAALAHRAAMPAGPA